MDIEKLQEQAFNVICQAMEGFVDHPNLALNAAKFFLMNFRVENKPTESLYDLEKLNSEEKTVFIEMLDKITVKRPAVISRLSTDENQFSLL